MKQGVQCPVCNKRIFSWSRHDFKTCDCPNHTVIDGGDSYLRYGGELMPTVVEYSEELDGRKVQSKQGDEE